MTPPTTPTVPVAVPTPVVRERGDAYAAACPCRDMLDLLANKWSTLVISALADGPLRFGAVRTRLEGVSPKVLTQTLRRLEAHGLLVRTVFPAVPLHVEYALTDLGRSALAPLDHLRRWVEENAGPERVSEHVGATGAGDLPG